MRIFKSIILILCLAASVQPARAVYVKPAIEAAAAVGATVPVFGRLTVAASAVHLVPTRAKHKKHSLLHRVGRALRSLVGDNQIVAAILAYLVGYIGVHRFYLGYTTIGIIQAAMGLIGFIGSFFIIGIPILIAVSIWALIDLIRILTGGLQPKGGSYSETI